MEQKINSERLKQVITYLQTKPKVKCNPYPDYDARIFEVLRSLGEDRCYVSNHTKIMDKDISTMNLKNIKTMYTFMLRGERFADGCIMGFIEDGTLLKLVSRQLQLTGE